MQQRVKLALALASQAGLIVLDEPCANLDASVLPGTGKPFKPSEENDLNRLLKRPVSGFHQPGLHP